ncbi:MAG: hypothetical protein KME19_17320 [Microcoleus vaginatus WJT46-NPBG5]|nr:hypothetical protein [Microcoleus vaginatus WJT46-NPBG5]
MRFNQSFCTFMAATALAAPLVSLSVKSTQAQDQNLSFSLINRASSPLTEFYTSPTGVNNWERDILGVDVLNRGESAQVSIADGRRTCIYDIRGVFADGETVEDYRVNLCDLQSYEFFDRSPNQPVRALW